MWSWLQSWLQRGDEREFEVLIYEEDYKELCAFALRKPNIETGGDLFGLWANDHEAVIQLTLGPGKGRRRTSTSFYQDVKYLENVCSYLTENEGVCHIGEWHSHHQLGLARPSGGDENTVWNKMPTYNLSRFVIFIANIEASKQTYTVNISCFLFEIDTDKGNQLPVKEGKFKILHAENPFSQKKEVKKKRSEGAEHEGGDEGNIDIKDLKLVEREGDRPYVTFKRPIKRTLRDDDYQPKPKKNKSKKQTTTRGEDTVKNPERGEGSTCDKETTDPDNGERRDLSQEIQQGKSVQEDSDTSPEEKANEKTGEGTAGATEEAEKEKDDGEDGKEEHGGEKEKDDGEDGKEEHGGEKEKDDGEDGKEEHGGEKEKDDGEDGKEEHGGEKEKDDGEDGKEGNKTKNEMMGEEGKKIETEEKEEKQPKMKEKQEGRDIVDEKKSEKDNSKGKEHKEAGEDEVQPSQDQQQDQKSVSTEEARNQHEQQNPTECQGSKQGQENPEKKATSKGEQKGKPAASAPAPETSTAVGVNQEATTSATGKSKKKAQTKKKENGKVEKAAQPTKGKKDASKTPGGAKKAK